MQHVTHGGSPRGPERCNDVVATAAEWLRTLQLHAALQDHRRLAKVASQARHLWFDVLVSRPWLVTLR